jgi:hypothetical protein
MPGARSPRPVLSCVRRAAGLDKLRNREKSSHCVRTYKIYVMDLSRAQSIGFVLSPNVATAAPGCGRWHDLCRNRVARIRREPIGKRRNPQECTGTIATARDKKKAARSGLIGGKAFRYQTVKVVIRAPNQATDQRNDSPFHGSLPPLIFGSP